MFFEVILAFLSLKILLLTQQDSFPLKTIMYFKNMASIGNSPTISVLTNEMKT